MALYFGSTMLKVFKGTFFYDSLESLSQKIKTTLPPESIKYLKSVEQTMHMGIRPYKDYAKFRGILKQVNDAAAARKTIEIVYYTMSRKKETRRSVDPYRIWFFNGTFYLIGFCHMRDEVRVFALDRIKLLHQSKKTFEVPEDFDVEEFVRPSFGIYQGPATKVKIRFSPEVAGYIKESIWHESQRIIDEKDGSIIFEAEVAGTDEIRFWLMSWGSKAEVLEPLSLRDKIRTEAEAVMRVSSQTERGERFWHSRRSRSATPSNPAISSGLVLCWRSQPFAAQSFKLIGITYEEVLRFLYHCVQKMVVCRNLRPELIDGIDHRVYFPRQLFLQGPKSSHYVSQGDVAYHHHVDVAPPARFATGH
jgi:predicted DNA-binding transcriptional regulator YafY